MSTAPNVYIVFYSLYGHIYTLAKQIQLGLEAQGVNVKLYQVPETLSEEVLQKMGAPPKPDVPIITADELKEADAILWGIPTRFGSVPAQIKAFLDSTGGLWASGALAGKLTSAFVSSGSNHGGQESTVFNTLTYFAHHGLLYAPLGFADPHLFDVEEVVGGSAWSAGTIASGDGSRQVSDKEKQVATTQAKNFAKLVLAMHKGKAILEKANKVDEPQQTPVVQKQKEAAPAKEEQQPKPATPPKETKSDKTDKGVSKCFCM
ncbi:flavo protein-like protein [Absidia repens]|uniref:Flavo protein-like protein n=1 Tax=Absidia repens TaxID=90262 RepID=A0A1X2IWG5_9FUNG|nr:flavo protein-like protein [Absidia repens]